MFRKIFIKEDNRIRFIWKFIVLILCCFVVGRIVGALLGLAFKIYYAVTRGDVISTEELISNPTISVFTLFIEQLFMIFLIFFFIKKVDKLKLKDLGVEFTSKAGIDFLLGIFLSISGMILFIWFLDSFGLIVETNRITDNSNYNAFSFFVTMLYQIILFLFVAFQEELLFRVYMPQSIKGNKWRVATISAILFAIMHINNTGVIEVIQKIFNGTAFNIDIYINLILNFTINVFLFGFLLTLYFMDTKKFGTIFGIHFGWNLMESAILGFNISGVTVGDSFYTISLIPDINKQFLTGGKVIGPEAGLLVTIVFGVMGIMLLLLAHKKKENWD